MLVLLRCYGYGYGSDCSAAAAICRLFPIELWLLCCYVTVLLGVIEVAHNAAAAAVAFSHRSQVICWIVGLMQTAAVCCHSRSCSLAGSGVSGVSK